jgi:hypothetical protein
VRRAALLAASTSVIAALAMPTAEAREATSEQVRSLAGRAKSDPAALADLRSVDSVDGRAVDLSSALDTTNEGELGARLDALSGGATTQGNVDAARARESARDILDDPRYRTAEPPKPFRSVLDRIGDFLDRTVTQPIGRAWDALVRWIPGHETTLWVLLCIVVVGLVVLVAWRVGRRRQKGVAAHSRSVGGAPPRDRARDLERRAAEAEARGELKEAIRLWFRAGLVRLDDAGAIDYRSSLTAGQVRRRLRLEPFDRVSGAFEEVVYGGRAPDADDVSHMRSGWAEVMDAVAA